MGEAENLEPGARKPLRARSDGEDRLIEADDALMALQQQCGGEAGGIIAIPALLELVRKARLLDVRVSRWLEITGAKDRLCGMVEIRPHEGGCAIRIARRGEGAGGRHHVDPALVRDDVDRLTAAAVVWLDRDRRIVAVDSEAADLAEFAEQASAARGQHWSVLFDGAEGEDGPFAADLAGSGRPWRVRLYEGQAQAMVLLHLDTAAMRQRADAEEDLLPDSLLGEGLASALREPVAGIAAQAEMLGDRRAGPLPDGYRDYARDIAVAAQHLSRLHDNLADGEPQPAREPVDLREIAGEAQQLLQGRAEERGIRIEVTGGPAHALADRGRILQIVLNLLGNAIAYGRAEGIVRLDCRDGEMIVSNEGEGLSPQQQARIFDKYERLGRSGDGGTGLGLAIARRLARSMNGDLTVSSGPGEGASFVLTLPVR